VGDGVTRRWECNTLSLSITDPSEKKKKEEEVEGKLACFVPQCVATEMVNP